MPWYFPWSDNIKKRSCRYLLQRYLGQFLEEKLSLDQLTVDLYNGTGSVSDVTLDVQALNELAEQQNWPIEFIDGFISEISVSIPWSSLLCDSSTVEVKGLYLAIQPKQRMDNGMSMFESMRSSMTSSIQLAEECLKQTSSESEQITPLDGLELFAETIDSILTRVKLNFLDTIIRLEHLPKENKVGLALEIHIQHFSYFDESTTDTNSEENVKHASSFSVKNVSLQGISLYMDEFHSANRTICRSLMIESTSFHQSCTEDVDPMNVVQQTIEKQRNTNAENIILIGQILGRQQMRIKIKESESTSGPKIDFEANINSVIILLSPRQLHACCKIVYGLMSPHLQDNSNVSRSRFHEKPMSTFDFERVEQELIQQVNPSGQPNSRSRCLQNTTGWSSAGALGDDSDDDFRPMKNLGTCNSLSSSITTSVTSSNSNQTDSYQYNSKLQGSPNTYYNQRARNKPKGVSNMECDLIGDINRFHVRLNSISVVMLHDDVFKEDLNDLLSESCINLMKNISNQFFIELTSFYINGYNLDVMNRRELISNAIPNYTYFSLMANTILVSIEHKTMNTVKEMNGTFTIADVELLECLRNNENNPEYIPLLRFMKNERRPDEPLPKFTVSSKPDIFIRFKYSDNRKRYSNPRDIDIQTNIQQCWSEIDITVIDRLNDITKHLKQFYDSIKEKGETKDNIFYHAVNSSPTDMRFEWKITAAFYLIKFRIPIPNIVPVYHHHPQYEKSKHDRNVYDDIFLIELIDPSVQSNMTTHQMANSYELQSNSFRVLFQEANTDEPIPFILSCADEPAGVTLPNHGLGFGLPRLVLRKYPIIPYVELDDEDEMEKSKMNQSIIMDHRQKEPSPFAAKKIMRESESNTNGEGEESVLPGSKEEIANFIEDASTSALIQLDISLPNITIRIPTKHFYELVYNRMSNDLLLWSPASSKTPPYRFKNASTREQQLNDPIYESFSMCKSSTKYASDSEEENEEVESNKVKKQNELNKQSKLTISVFAAQAVLDIFPHARDSTGNVIPEQFGEIQIMVEEGSLFLVSGYKGRPLLSFICLQLNRLALYHTHMIPHGIDTSLKHVNHYPSKYLKSTIYRTEQTAIVNDTFPQVGIGSCNSDDMFTLAVKIHANEKRVKDICIASSLCGSTLRHRSAPAYGSWLTQLINFFDVIDYPILNYQPMKIITQLHQQFLNCILDYRPLHIPYRTAVSFDNFNISSNITAKMSSSVLRFVAEEVSVFISNKPSKNDVIDIRNDYICVIELGLFDLSLRLSDNTDIGPHIDLRASNNIVHIRTCADSAVILMELIKYIASDGDFIENKENNKKHNNNNHNNKKYKDKDALIHIKNDENVEEINFDIMSSYMERIPDLMDEAMNDTSSTRSNRRGRKKHESESVEMFFFPDEENHVKASNISSDSQTSDDDFENEYCLLENDFSMYMTDTNTVPEVRMLTNNPIKVVDNYFSLPMARVDVLKAPKDYPPAVARYTLREMTLVWHMYGGYDFTPTNKSTNSSPKHVSVMERSSCQDLTTVAYYDNKDLSRPSSLDSIATSNTSSYDFSPVQFLAARSSPIHSSSSSSSRSSSLNTLCEQKANWKTQGGAKRQHDVLLQLQLTKMKYQYEVYPETTKQASRQVLVVQEVEIRDRLASSNINKFLYQYFSSSRPKQSNANMVVIKATNIRPEENMKHIEECCLRVSVLPIRLNIDQDSLLFLLNFINNISENSKETKGNSDGLPNGTLIDENDDSFDESSSISSECYDTPLFIRSFVFSPDVPIRLDYEGKRVDMSHGPLAGLVMGLGQLNCSELRLKGIYNRHGFLGLEKLISYVLTEWLNDIKKNQLPSILGGVGPMYSLVQLIHGIFDLFWLPIEQYQKDGRIVRGLQRGANSFTTSTAMAALELTTRIVYAIQLIAETAFDFVSPGPSIRCLKYDKSSKHDTRKNSKYKYNQPADIREGVANALLLVREGFGETAQTLVRVASIEHEVKGTVGAVGGVLRQIPSTALTPIILASQATSNVLGGVKSQLVPDARTEAALKWRNDYF